MPNVLESKTLVDFRTLNNPPVITYEETDCYIFRLRSLTCLNAVGRLPPMLSFSQEPLGFSRRSFKDDCRLSDIKYAAFC